MNHRRSPGHTLTVLLAALLMPGSLQAQSADGFLFGRPTVRVDLFGGLAVPRAGSQVFDFTTDELTLERSDFQGPLFGVGVAYRTSERLDLGIEVAFSRASEEAEYRDFEGTDGLPIVQTTEFSRTPLTLVGRLYLRERGTSVGRLAWVPASWSPYVGGGVGVTWYSFAREGEFVNSETLDIVFDRVEWDGAAPTAQVLAGLEWSVSPRVLLRGEGRYSWASGDDSSEFEGFDPLDLAGLGVTLGLSLRF